MELMADTVCQDTLKISRTSRKRHSEDLQELIYHNEERFNIRRKPHFLLSFSTFWIFMKFRERNLELEVFFFYWGLSLTPSLRFPVLNGMSQSDEGGGWERHAASAQTGNVHPWLLLFAPHFTKFALKQTWWGRFKIPGKASKNENQHSPGGLWVHHSFQDAWITSCGANKIFSRHNLLGIGLSSEWEITVELLRSHNIPVYIGRQSRWAGIGGSAGRGNRSGAAERVRWQVYRYTT